MKKNMGKIDKTLRLVIAAVIAVVLFTKTVLIGSTLGIVLAAVAGIFALTSLVSSCPLYSIVGLNTDKKN